jgi:molecular chaperone DnaK (HSP70)
MPEKAKIKLSSSTQTDVICRSLPQISQNRPKHLNIMLSRARLEALVAFVLWPAGRRLPCASRDGLDF